MADLWLLKDIDGATVAVTSDREQCTISIHGKGTICGTDFESIHTLDLSELDTLIAALTEARRAIS